MADIEKLAAALAKAQAKIDCAKKDKKNDHFRSKYADLASVWDACREALTENGLSVVQMPMAAPAGFVGLETILLHESGQSLSATFHMPVKDATNPQAVGSALTYARRYALSAFVSVAPAEDDGTAAAAQAATSPIGSPRQVDDPAKLKAAFDKASGVGQKKQVFLQAKASNMDEVTKLGLLKGMSEVIKAMQENV